jgi:tetratricopeptide (TPR) repeat protein
MISSHTSLFKNLVLFLCFILFSAGYLSAQKTITIHPVKRDSADSQKKRMQNYYSDTLFKYVPGVGNPKDTNELKAQKLFVQGTKLAQSGDYEGAIETFSRSLAIDEYTGTYMKRGYAYLLKDNLPLAIQDFTDALRLMPANKLALLGRGIARFQLNDYSGAQTDLKAYIDLDSKNAMAYNYMAAACFMRQDYNGALVNYDEVVKLDSTYPDIYTNRGMMRHYLRDFNGAVQDYDKAIALKPGNASSYNNRAAANMMLGDFESALADLNKAIELNPMYADAYDNRGRVKQRLGNLDGACQDWQKAFSLGLQTSRDLIIKNCK